MHSHFTRTQVFQMSCSCTHCGIKEKTCKQFYSEDVQIVDYRLCIPIFESMYLNILFNQQWTQNIQIKTGLHTKRKLYCYRRYVTPFSRLRKTDLN